MYTVKTRTENKKAVNAFRERLSEIAYKQDDYEWGFPNGDRVTYPTYSIKTQLGEIQIGVPKSWDNRVPHLIRFKKDGPPSPDVEINIPIEHDRRISGLYVNTGNEYLLCSRGSFNAFRGQIKHEVSLSYFDKWLIEIDDNGKPANVISVCSLSSPTLADDIATFTFAVLELKRLHKEGLISIENTQSTRSDTTGKWKLSEEFEGTKVGGGSQRTEYEFLHGPICNRLIKFLEKSNSSNALKMVVKNQHLDAAIVNKKADKADTIFEVKTAALPSSQIYSAVGQLSYYKFKYGHKNTQLVLVLPAECRCKATEKFLTSLGIYTAYEEKKKFVLPDGNELSSVL